MMICIIVIYLSKYFDEPLFQILQILNLLLTHGTFKTFKSTVVEIRLTARKIEAFSIPKIGLF
jgi:hypothetical protein